MAKFKPGNILVAKDPYTYFYRVQVERVDGDEDYTFFALELGRDADISDLNWISRSYKEYVRNADETYILDETRALKEVIEKL